MAEDDILPTLRPEDVQAVVAGLAANPNAMVHFMERATSTTGSSDQPVSSSLSNSKLCTTITIIRYKLLLTPPNPDGLTHPAYNGEI